MKGVELSNWIRSQFPSSSDRSTRVSGYFINDADYVTQPRVNNKQIKCPAYMLWTAMITRCYNESELKKHKTYIGAHVCDEWSSFMRFRSWWVEHYVDGWQLDKDLIHPGNKEYSPERCIYVPQWLNKFTTGRDACRGSFPIGVSWNKRDKIFAASCQHPKGGQIRLGTFRDEHSAHMAWLSCKISFANELREEIESVMPGLHSFVVEKIKSMR